MRCCFIERRDRILLEKIIGYCDRIADNLNRYQNSFDAFQSDLLFQDACCMCIVQIGELVGQLSKEVAVSLLAKIKEKIAQLDHWTDKQETKAVVDTLIRDTLWNELPECYDDLSISRYRQQIYEYVYTRYPNVA